MYYLYNEKELEILRKQLIDINKRAVEAVKKRGVKRDTRCEGLK